jgi:hypothetical protein
MKKCLNEATPVRIMAEAGFAARRTRGDIRVAWGFENQSRDVAQ